MLCTQKWANETAFPRGSSCGSQLTIVAILCYHSVQSDWQSPLAVTPEAFAQHCAWLARHRRVVDLAEAVARMDGRARLPRPLAALTFDDGFGGLYQHAFPMLHRYQLAATVFLVAETLAPKGRAVDWVQPLPSQPLTTLDRGQVMEMQAAGIQFGSHSFAHKDLTTLDEDACLSDLKASRELLEELLRKPVPFLAYPGGRHDAMVRRAAERAGFTHAFSLPVAREPRSNYAVPRVGVWPGNGVMALRLKTSPWYLSLRTSGIFPLLRVAAPGKGEFGNLSR
jgi:peptidoglycan/xylan/chitin deacetylase (PgdA/CDA1 family)